MRQTKGTFLIKKFVHMCSVSISGLYSAAAPPISRPESFPPVMVNNAPTNVMDEMRCWSLLITLRAI